MSGAPLSDVSIEVLRSWAEAGVISHGRYVEEIQRRRREQAEAARLVALESLGENMPECKGDLLHHPIGSEA